MKTYPISERLRQIVPDRWANVSYDKITPEQIADMIADITARGHGINLNIPLTPETFAHFMQVLDCDRCGACCRDDLKPTARNNKGIALGPDDLWRLAKIERMSPKAFRRQFCRRYYINGQKTTALRYPCRYWSTTTGCRIYSERPFMCRFYPVEKPTAITGTGTVVDGVGTLIVDGACPRANRLAVMLVTAQVIAQQRGYLEALAPQTTKIWEQAKEWQRGKF